MNPEQVQRLSGALRAQAAGLASEVSERPRSPGVARTAQPAHRLPAWAVLALAVLLGAMAGGVAGVISAW